MPPQTNFLGCGACAEGFKKLFRQPQLDHEELREDFERTVEFLSSVPLFRHQLPRAQLPKVAQELQRKVWAPGQILVTQGEIGLFFFLIQSGEAVAGTSDCDGKLQDVHATLSAGDYFGGHTLITERPNIATIRAGDYGSLVTLSLCRETFEKLGLRRWLSFPKRPALYDASARVCPCKPMDDQARPTTRDLLFLKKAFKKNVNLRALFEASPEQIDKIISAAERRLVHPGEVVVKCDSVGDEFFIILEGSFDMVLQSRRSSGRTSGSVENVVCNSLLAERIVRKQNFFKNLSHGQDLDNLPSTTSVESRRPRASSDSDNLDDMCHTSSKNANLAQTGCQRRSTVAVGVDNAMVKRPSCGREAGILVSGDSFGELSILFNAKREATYRARESSVVYAIKKASFLTSFGHGTRPSDSQEYLTLLQEVFLLAPLLSSELHELARQAVGFIDISPGTRFIHQGSARKDPHWYVIASGKATVTLSEDESALELCLANISWAAHFGEYDLLRRDVASRYSVTACAEGLRCLAIDGEAILPLLQKVMKTAHEDGFEEVVDVKELWARKARGFKRGSIVQKSNTMLVDKDMAWERNVSRDSAQMASLALSDLSKVGVLGKGGFGYVTLVENTSSGERYALKACSKGHIQLLGCQRLVCWERELLSMIDSKFIIRMHRTFKDKQHIYFLFEAATGGSLLDILRDEPEILASDCPRGYNAAFYVACITAALEHLHERRIVHRDVKPQNTLLNSAGYAKLCDMGFSRFVLTKTSTLVGTPEYMAPEVIDFPHTHDSAVDWWALGVVAYELLAGQTPFDDDGTEDPFRRLLAIRRSQEQTNLRFDFHFPDVAKTFVSSLLKKTPSQRLGAGPRGPIEVRRHAMYEKLNFDFEAFQEQHLPAPMERKGTIHAPIDDSDSDSNSDSELTGTLHSQGNSIIRGSESEYSHGVDSKCSIFVEIQDSTDDWAAKF